MTSLYPLLLTTPALLLIATVLIPSKIANSNARLIRQMVTWIAAVQFAIGLGMGTALVTGMIGSVDTKIYDWTVTLGVHYDSVAALMFALVSFVGWVICRYSIRYLDGEQRQGDYFRWTGFTLAAVCLFVIADNLLMFMGSWVMTSLGLHRLLLHYPERPAAQRAAWTKFIISRIGDAALASSFVLIYLEFGTFNFAELLAAAKSVTESTPMMDLASFMLVVGAVTKSAQFPFHTWLPLTMETPTPVSALMHAGIVNAGGYLIIRTSPILSLTPSALTVLAIIGGFTACFAAVVMLTQTSVKKSLAYSTIAQMGFMLLQCGLGAYSAAMLHILAHSLYKAHSFLSSGSVMTQRSAMLGARPQLSSFAPLKFIVASVAVIGFFAGSMYALGVDLAAKPGGLLLGGILCLALAHWIGQAIKTGSGQLIARASVVSAGLCVMYAISFVAVDKTIAASLPAATYPAATFAVTILIAIGFAGVLALQTGIASVAGRERLKRAYVHASNGFYVEPALRHLAGSFTRS